MTITQYLKFCHYTANLCGENIKEELKKFCKEQYINNYHLFGTDLVVNSLLNDYHFPCGLVVSLRDNIEQFTIHLQAQSTGGSHLGNEEHAGDESNEE